MLPVNDANDLTTSDGQLAGWRIWQDSPGSQDIVVPAGLNFLDVHLGGAPCEYHVVEADADGHRQEATFWSLPNSFAFLPSGLLREIRTVRTGPSVRVVLAEREFRARHTGTLPPVRCMMEVPDRALVGAASIFSESWPSRGGSAVRDLADPFVTILVARPMQILMGDVFRGPALRPKAVQKALSYVEEHVEGPLPLSKVAQVAGVSPFHFARLFRASMGTSLHAYILERRVSLAERLIRDTEVGLAEIAYQAGFGSQSHMTTVFRRRTGSTPGEHRRGRHGGESVALLQNVA